MLDYDRDEIRFDGEVLPFALSTVTASVDVAPNGNVDVTLTLRVDQVQTVAAQPKPAASDVQEWPMPPTPEEIFEKRLASIRESNGQQA